VFPLVRKTKGEDCFLAFRKFGLEDPVERLLDFAGVLMVLPALLGIGIVPRSFNW
jgi:hypothetical protein